MNEEEKRLVAEKVNSGSYFAEGVNWYNSRFIKPQTEFIQSTVLALIAVAIFTTGFYAFIQLFPLKQGSAILLSEEIQAHENVSVNKIMGDRETPTQAYIKFMLQEFVKTFEEYRVEKIERNQQFILQIAAENLSAEYILANDRSNPDAPIVKYGNQGLKAVYVDPDTITLSKEITETAQTKTQEATAKLGFVATLLLNNNQQSTTYEADIKFQYKEMIIDQKTHEIKQLPQIIITDYKIKPI